MVVENPLRFQWFLIDKQGKPISKAVGTKYSMTCWPIVPSKVDLNCEALEQVKRAVYLIQD